VLLQAGQRAGLGHGFSLQLLQQAELLGLQGSLNMCEEVLASCIKQKDYASASLTWLLAKAHCMLEPRSSSSAAAGQELDAAAAAEAAALPAGSESWASKNMVRLYARGMAQWLQEGGVSFSHKKRLQEQLQALAQELTVRGARVPEEVQQALQDSDVAGDAGSSVSGEGQEEAAVAEEQPVKDDGKAPSNA
jgi:hypothetical protein